MPAPSNAWLRNLWPLWLMNYSALSPGAAEAGIHQPDQAQLAKGGAESQTMSENAFQQQPFGDPTFAENPENRCPVVLVLDNSGSMGGPPIQQLNEGLQLFQSELVVDFASKRVDVAIVTFGPVRVETDFTNVMHFVPPTISAAADTPMGAAIEKALEILQARKAVYKQNGIAYYRPWVFLITDGAPTDAVSRATQLIKEGEEKNSRVTVFFMTPSEIPACWLCLGDWR